MRDRSFGYKYTQRSSEGTKMKRILSLFCLVLLTGCATQAVPVKPKFPEAIQSLMVPCPELKEVQQTTKLSEVVSGVTQNYGMYHKCKLQNEMWIEWYNDQKKIYDEVK